MRHSKVAFTRCRGHCFKTGEILRTVERVETLHGLLSPANGTRDLDQPDGELLWVRDKHTKKEGSRIRGA